VSCGNQLMIECAWIVCICRAPHFSPSMAKSSIQKNIRRCKVASAVRMAAFMICDGMGVDLVRRLSVIMLEDAILHPAFPLLTWLSSSISHGYHPPPNIWFIVLQIVFELAAVRVRDPMYEVMAYAPLSQFPVSVNVSTCPSAFSVFSCMIFSLLMLMLMLMLMLIVDVDVDVILHIQASNSIRTLLSPPI
jgi:hypothetical protein